MNIKEYAESQNIQREISQQTVCSFCTDRGKLLIQNKTFKRSKEKNESAPTKKKKKNWKKPKQTEKKPTCSYCIIRLNKASNFSVENKQLLTVILNIKLTETKKKVLQCPITVVTDI